MCCQVRRGCAQVFPQNVTRWSRDHLQCFLFPRSTLYKDVVCVPLEIALQQRDFVDDIDVGEKQRVWASVDRIPLLRPEWA